MGVWIRMSDLDARFLAQVVLDYAGRLGMAIEIPPMLPKP